MKQQYIKVPMLKLIAGRNRQNYASIVDLITRDMPLQYPTVVFLYFLCWYLMGSILAIWNAVTLGLSTICILLMVNQKRPFHKVDKDTRILLLLMFGTLNSTLYVVPSVILIAHPSPALKLTGLIWVLGAQIYVMTSWSRIPTFLIAFLIPIMGMIVASILVLAVTTVVVSPTPHWAVAVSFVAIYIYSCAEALRRNITSDAALLKSENISIARLAQMEQAQRIDPLTGLLNRSAFDVALDDMLVNREHSGGEVTTFLIDLDSFKPINDTYSHEAGDAVLIATAKRIKAEIGGTGIVGRMGGDEFICARSDLCSQQDALTLADALVRRLGGLVSWNGRKLRTTASVGIAMTGTHSAAPAPTVAVLCAAADQAMFAAKGAPNRAPVLYDADQFRPRMTPDDKQILVESLANEAVRPFYQPKVHLVTGQIVGFEALARWNHPTLGERTPGDFIEQIDELGMQGDFMMAMARQVFRDVDVMLARGLDPGQVSLNLSEVALATFSGRHDLHRIVAAHPAAARHMTFEITEDVFIARDADAIQSSMETFRGLGVRISLDDFGTGFASFDHLRQLDFDELKIDTSFVASLEHDSTSQVLVQGFLSIASGLGVGVVAEGVETDAQRTALSNMGCVVAQGYLFSTAIPFERAVEILANQAA